MNFPQLALIVTLTLVGSICLAQSSSSNATYGGQTKDGDKKYVQPAGPTDTTKSPYVRLPDNRPPVVRMDGSGPPEPVRLQGTGKSTQTVK